MNNTATVSFRALVTAEIARSGHTVEEVRTYDGECLRHDRPKRHRILCILAEALLPGDCVKPRIADPWIATIRKEVDSYLASR